MPNFSKLLLLTAAFVTLTARGMEEDYGTPLWWMREDLDIGIRLQAAQTLLWDPAANPGHRRRAAEIMLGTLDPMTMTPHHVESLNQIFQALGRNHDPTAPGMDGPLLAAATRMLGAVNHDARFAAAQALVPYLDALKPAALVQMQEIAEERELGPDARLRLAIAIVNCSMPSFLLGARQGAIQIVPDHVALLNWFFWVLGQNYYGIAAPVASISALFFAAAKNLDLGLPPAFEHYPGPNPVFPLAVQRAAAQTILGDPTANPVWQRGAAQVMLNTLDPTRQIMPDEIPGWHQTLRVLVQAHILQSGHPLLVRAVVAMEGARAVGSPMDLEIQVPLAIAAIRHPDVTPPNGMTPDLLRVAAQVIVDHPEGVLEDVLQRAQQILNAHP
ncbi:MAG: hypothetical protein LBJ70_00335 [Holosporales bacterium]|nr:hypothetical protein [Holosporales bacterium]